MHALVVGAGPLGRSATAHLVADDHRVTLVTRSATSLPGARPLAADVTSADLPARLPDDIEAVVACCNFPYGRWDRYWPSAIRNLIAAAERSGAVLVLAGNLYAYAPPTRPMRETDPQTSTTINGRVRALVWSEAMTAHEAGRVRVVEVRGSDYVGPGAGANSHATRVVPAVLGGGTARPLGDPEQPHTWTAVDDFGRLLARATRDEAMWGRAWHVPSAPAVSMREYCNALRATAGLPGPARVSALPGWVVRSAGLVSADLRSVGQQLYQFERPFVMDDSDARTMLGESHTDFDQTLAAVVAQADRR
ncbi:NAD-dependent epimerase/dehydratase family protein [Brooklawnia cerclae]|uniref:Nucleoside-diphosphate-sugar epimerase n=1 Tax=Brooklawnia cerclae TaxID=349934 RepID=A0ABX0SBY3_9ACTN|nr:NAD-dependent epimerase/dehydratase family protein [Brooklawnia cerclae]NIH55895.1 nucleoside-diphosphate-sugar epimerase [Brooklawnia cerclae]